VIYLDANATTPLHPEVHRAMEAAFGDGFGNPSSLHAEGQRARALVDRAREQCARALEVRPKELTFTSGGTEAAQLALWGLGLRALEDRAAGRPHPPLRLVTTAVEHACVLGAAEGLQALGVELVRVGVDAEGRLDLAALQRALGPGALLCSVVAANNETGVLSPLPAVSALCRARGVPLHTDAVQLAGRAQLRPEELGVDLLSLSGHKLQGPKGAGLLWTRRGLTLRAVQPGGHQERGLRGGTENVAAAVGLGEALARTGELLADLPRQRALRDRLQERLLQIPGSRVAGGGAERLGNTLCALFDGCDGETLLVALDLAGVAVSTGAACSSGTQQPSHVLLAMGLAPAEARGAVRFSLWRGNTAEEIDRLCALLPDLVARARRGGGET
jgi:cysteine desulfurase